MTFSVKLTIMKRCNSNVIMIFFKLVDKNNQTICCAGHKMLHFIYCGLKQLINCYSYMIRRREYTSSYAALTLENEFQFPFFLITHCKSISVLCAMLTIVVVRSLMNVHWIIKFLTICVLCAMIMNWIVKVAHNANHVSDTSIYFAIQGDYIFGHRGLLHYLPMCVLRVIFRILPFQEWYQFQQTVSNSVNTTAHLLYSNACIHNIQVYVIFVFQIKLFHLPIVNMFFIHF